MMQGKIPSFTISPENTCLEMLSPLEIEGIYRQTKDSVNSLLERCVLAVLNCGSESDDVKSMMEIYNDFSLDVIQTAAEIRIVLHNAPQEAFVTYETMENKRETLKMKMIEGIRQHIFAVLRDLVFIKSEIENTNKFDLKTSKGITDAIFLILRNAGIFEKTGHHKIIVCWGGHAVSEHEYLYSSNVGNQCGLRFMDIITGCGPGVMRGPMEGAAIAHAKQRIKTGRYIGISEPGIISSEAPNPIVDPLVIMPDIEKRLEAFVRMGQGILIFPGGAGTAEEIMYILGILSHPRNQKRPFPLILTGPLSSKPYFESLHKFLCNTLGEEVTNRYTVILDDPERVAKELNNGLLAVKRSRESSRDSYYFNRTLHIPKIFQDPFIPTHENIRKISVNRNSETYIFSAQLRRIFSAIVAGNVKPDGIRAVEQHGPFLIQGESSVMREIDLFLSSLAAEKRMRLKGEYKPCYKIIS